MSRPLIAIGLDSAEPAVIEQWLEEGKLPNLAKVRGQGSYRRLRNFDAYSAETPWTTFLTGVSPEKTGYWSPIGFVEGSYDVRSIAAYDFAEYPPFYALGPDRRVAAFDVPQVRLNEDVHGVQVSAWGAHSPQVPSGSLPAGLFDEITARYGAHPGLHDDYSEALHPARTRKVAERLRLGAERRGEICADLVAREAWDLFVTVFGETHGGGHNLWHHSQPDHPLYDAFRGCFAVDPMLELFQTIDTSIGRILAAAPSDANVVIFSAHGMGPNTMDLPSMAFLPEFMYRRAFPGRTCLPGDASVPLPPIAVESVKNSWIKQTWSEVHDPSRFAPLRRFLKQNLPWRYQKPFTRLLDRQDEFAPSNPYALKDTGLGCVPWQPARWMQRLWPRMDAFALPSFAEGYIRVNLQGREPQGTVAPEDYERFLDGLVGDLEGLRDARTGQPMARKILRTRKSADDPGALSPDADLVIVWQDEYATDVVESPEFGRIGPLGHYRSGSHRPVGFLIAGGPDIAERAGSAAEGHALDLAPTLLSLIGAPVPEHCEGTSLL